MGGGHKWPPPNLYMLYKRDIHGCCKESLFGLLRKQPQFVLKQELCHKDLRHLAVKGELNLVFPNGKGNVESHANIFRRCFGAIQHECKIVDGHGKPKYGIHAFRHYAISTFIDMGYPPKRVQDIAGHSTLAMTMDTYGHLFPDPEGDADMMRRAELRLVS